MAGYKSLLTCANYRFWTVSMRSFVNGHAFSGYDICVCVCVCVVSANM